MPNYPNTTPVLARRDHQWITRTSMLAGGLVGGGILVGIALDSVAIGAYLAYYFVPFLIAACRGTRYDMVVLAINTLLGWTVIGWIVALIIALLPHRERR